MVETDSDVFLPVVHCLPDISSNQGEIPIINSCSYEQFFENHLLRNQPCIIKKVGKDWEATKKWCQDNKPCYNYLRNKYGRSTITVHHCGKKYFDSHKTSEMKFEEYVDYWEKYSKVVHKSEMELLYLKDWHMENEYTNDDFYEVPLYFSSDWLNEYLVATRKDDYRFVYMGPAGSWTPLHKDVMNSFSWSVNICGLKKWILFPPGEEKKLMNKFGKLPHSIDTLPEDIKYFHVTQGPGDAIFVPSKWYHQVCNLDDTISINHNWINAANIKHMEQSLSTGLEEIRREMAHLSADENFGSDCQNILKQHVGMNYEDFLEFMRFIAMRRIENFTTASKREAPQVDYMIVNDLKHCESMFEDDWKNNLSPDNLEEVEKLLQQIESVLGQK